MSLVTQKPQQPQNQRKEKEVVQKDPRHSEFEVSVEYPGGDSLDTVKQAGVLCSRYRFEIEKLILESCK